MLKKITTFFVFLVLAPLWGGVIRQAPLNLLHEGYLTSVEEITLNEVISEKPPPRIREVEGSGEIEGTIWIRGYWSYSKEGFLWVSGIWRCPPPGCCWVPGFWKKVKGGWTWFRGFWSPLPWSDCFFLPPPPLPEEARCGQIGDHEQWVCGRWEPQTIACATTWVWKGGRSIPIERDWVYIPGHCVWRPGGYFWVPGYWDWPIDQVGQAYSSVVVEASDASSVLYEPQAKLSSASVAEALLPVYPNYVSYVEQSLVYGGFWSCYDLPWWGRRQLCGTAYVTKVPCVSCPICLEGVSNLGSGYEQWAIWWWWTHPGYPAPDWMDQGTAEALSPPSQGLVDRMDRYSPPAWVTNRGVVDRARVEWAASRVLGWKDDPCHRRFVTGKQVKKIRKRAAPKKGGHRFRPQGKDVQRKEPQGKKLRQDTCETPGKNRICWNRMRKVTRGEKEVVDSCCDLVAIPPLPNGGEEIASCAASSTFSRRSARQWPGRYYPYPGDYATACEPEKGQCEGTRRRRVPICSVGE